MKIIAAVVLAALYSVAGAAGAADVAKPLPPVIMTEAKPVAPQRLLIRRPQRVLVDPDLVQDWHVIEYSDWDWHLGRARPRLLTDSTDWDSDHVSDQVQARLTLARARAMARYWEISG